MQSLFRSSIFITIILFSGLTFAQDIGQYLKLDKDGIKVYIFGKDSPNIASFRAVTHIDASMDSVLAVMFDNKNCKDWVHACKNSFIINDVSFNERYHYQSLAIPFPFKNREFIFRSVMKQNVVDKSVTILMFSAADYCHQNQSAQCQEVNQSGLVRVKRSIGMYKLKVEGRGTTISWVQYTDPAGKLPNWLVNQFVAQTPYHTFKNLAEKVKEEKYKYAKLIYDLNGNATALNMDFQQNLLETGYVQYSSF